MSSSTYSYWDSPSPHSLEPPPEASSPPLGSPSLGLGEGLDLPPMASINQTLVDSSLHHNIMQLRQQQQIQQDLLLQQYRHKSQELSQFHEQQLQLHMQQQQQQQEEEEHLTKHHQKQLQEHIQYLEEQTQKAEEERQRLEEEKIEAIKKKEKHEHSAVASVEVKKWLQEKLLRKIRDNNQNAVPGGATNNRNWAATGLMSPGSEDFPLRKTASEPNIFLKARLKQRMIDRRSSPIGGRRKDARFGAAPSRRRPLPYADNASNPDSRQSSPPNGLPMSPPGSNPIHEEGPSGSPYGPAAQGSCSDLTHPFSSLPNISLGRPPHSTQSEGSKLASVSETERVTAARAGMPITKHLLPSTLPNYPTLPVIDSEVCSASSPLRGHRGIATMDTTAAALAGTSYHIGGITPVPSLTEVQQARLNRTFQRPLGRTQSAPLPLGHPMLQGGGPPPSFLPAGGAHAAPNAPQQQQFDLKSDHHTSNIIKQHIRQAVLKRTGSKNHVENVEEETEAAVAEAIANEKTPPEVIDLTEGGRSPMSHQEHIYIHHAWGDLQPIKPPNVYSMMQPFGPRSGTHLARPLSRASSSPTVTSFALTGSHQEPISISNQGSTTGLAYDSLMQMHQCVCGTNESHPEHGGRTQAVWNCLLETGLVARCQRVPSRKATLEEIQSCHSEAHTLFFGTINRQHLDFRKLGELPIKNFVKLPCRGIGVDSDTTWNELHTSAAARLAVGCTLELAFKVAAGELHNGYAAVRPPGHHAEYQQAMGFCFFNTVAITAKQLHQKLGLDKILILDWDVHHGNGTQAAFYDDPHILYLSMHRYDDGRFFPGTGAPSEVGEGDGFGFTVNVAWSGGLNPPMGDAEYLAAFRSVILPIAKSFDPDIVLVSAGFDSADQHPPTLGGYKVSPACFGYMTSALRSVAHGKVVLVLEGGYELDSISRCSEACVRALLGDRPLTISQHEASRPPCRNAVETLRSVISYQVDHWPVLRRSSGTLSLSHLEATGREDEQETVSAMASLRVDQHPGCTSSPESVKTCTPPRSPHDEEEPMDEEAE